MESEVSRVSSLLIYNSMVLVVARVTEEMGRGMLLLQLLVVLVVGREGMMAVVVAGIGRLGLVTVVVKRGNEWMATEVKERSSV